MDAWSGELLGLSVTAVFVLNLATWAIFAAIKALRIPDWSGRSGKGVRRGAPGCETHPYVSAQALLLCGACIKTQDPCAAGVEKGRKYDAHLTEVMRMSALCGAGTMPPTEWLAQDVDIGGTSSIAIVGWLTPMAGERDTQPLRGASTPRGRRQ